MGAENSTYIGIYLEIAHVKSTITETKYCHPETGKVQKHRFDENTGQENIKKTTTREEYKEPRSYIVDVDGLNEDEFFTPAYTGGGKRIQTFVLNSSKNKYGRHLDEIENYEVNINIGELINQFNIDYKKYLDYYKNLYGEVSVKYGIVNYAH